MFKELDLVTLRHAQPGAGLVAGAVGTVLEVLHGGAYVVEFANDRGETTGLLTLEAAQLSATPATATATL